MRMIGRIGCTAVRAMSSCRNFQSGSQGIHPQARKILDYWFEGCTTGENFDPRLPKKWFAGGPEIDQEIITSFTADVEKLSRGEYKDWKEHPQNNLAAIILSDQFTRSIYRGTPQMFEMDPLAKELAEYSLDTGMSKELGEVERIFLPFPFEHTESIECQNRAIQLFQQLMDEVEEKYGVDHPFVVAVRGNKEYAEAHQKVIVKYNRFPHRNQILGRESTAQELEGFKNGTIPMF